MMFTTTDTLRFSGIRLITRLLFVIYLFHTFNRETLLLSLVRTPSVFLDTQSYTLVERLCALWTIGSLILLVAFGLDGIEESGGGNTGLVVRFEPGGFLGLGIAHSIRFFWLFFLWFS